MSRLLVVDDEDKIRLVIREYAEFEGHEVLEAKDGMEAVSLVREQDFDLIIMDVMMPKLDGFSACKEIMKIKFIPVLMLSARSDEFDKLFGFELGIDDYVIKPFSPKELMARVKVIITRNKRNKNNSIINANNDGLVVDVENRSVMINGIKPDLTPKEAEILFYLAAKPNVDISKDEVIKNIWGDEFLGNEKTVDAQMRMLKLSLGEHNPIVELGTGYRYEVNV